MNQWVAIMVICIVAISAVSRVLRAKYNAEHGIITDRKGRVVQSLLQTQPQNKELQREVETLRERIKVLERIVTDKGYDVATQIEALRDARKIDALLDNRQAEDRA